MQKCTNVVPLTSPFAVNVALFGAKSSNLARAVAAGFSVPKGLTISRLCDKPIAEDIIDILGKPLAVRSSAVCEDSPNQSFAGFFETSLGVRSEVELADAFTIVKNSGKIVPPSEIAVLVQQMINATRAGVAFSRDPITGEHTVIIESNYGLGKSVVDGIVTPDSIEYRGGEIITYIGRKSKQIVMAGNGICEEDTVKQDADKCSLSEREIQEIATLACKVESELGFAADIEWAFDEDGTLWLLQARPITTLN